MMIRATFRKVSATANKSVATLENGVILMRIQTNDNYRWSQWAFIPKSIPEYSHRMHFASSHSINGKWASHPMIAHDTRSYLVFKQIGGLS